MTPSSSPSAASTSRTRVRARATLASGLALALAATAAVPFLNRARAADSAAILHGPRADLPYPPPTYRITIRH